MKCPLRTGIVGIGGFGSAHHGVFETLEARGLVRVVATCDPALPRLGEVCAGRRFAERGIETYEDFPTMIASHGSDLDLGVIAAPIHLHAEMHATLVDKRVACYLEKPPTLDPVELEQMIEKELDASIPTNVGFSFVHMPARIALKRRILSGEFGSMTRVSFLGLSRRQPSYFQRNNWSGKLIHNDRLLLDSCLGNAMSHFVNSILFFAGRDDTFEWARPLQLGCELYRANPIEGADTIFALGHLCNGIEIRIASSHACPNDEQLIEEVMEFESATITIRSIDQVSIQRPGRTEECFSMEGPSLAASVADYLDFLLGKKDRPAQKLTDCLGFVETNALFYLAARSIGNIPVHLISQQAGPDSAKVIPDVEDAARLLINSGRLPSDADFPWAIPGGQAGIDSIGNIERVVREMASNTKYRN